MDQQAKFTRYLRKQALYHVGILLLILLVVTVFTLLVAIKADSEDGQKQLMWQTAILLGVPVFINGIIYLLSRYYRLIFVDLVSPCMQVVFALMLVVVNASGVIGEISETMRAQQYYIMLVVYIILALFV